MKGLLKSLEIAVLASTLGIVLAPPIGLAAARNLMPPWVSWPARALIVMARSFHPVIVANLFVKAVGFGALAGILALTIVSIGFIGKLLTEAIEEISLKQVEAIRATGSPFASVLAFGVLPQVFSRFIGFATHQLAHHAGRGARHRRPRDLHRQRDAGRPVAPPQRRRAAARFLVYLVIVTAIVASVRTVEVIPEFLYDAPEQGVDLLTRMWPVDWPHYQETVHAALNLFQWDRVALILVAIVAVVVIAEIVVTQVRKRII